MEQNDSLNESLQEPTLASTSADFSTSENEAEEGAVGGEEELTSKEDSTDEESQPFEINAAVRPPKSSFKLKCNENGNILTVHHTVTDGDKRVRVRLGVCCFSAVSTQFVTIDKLGNIFVFDFATKKNWRLPDLIPRASVMRASIHRANEYLVGTKSGQLALVDVEQARVLQSVQISDSPIHNISFAGQLLQPPKLVLLHTGPQAVIVDLQKLSAAYRLDFDEVLVSLKFACYLPYSEQIFTCFTNDVVHLWSSLTLNTLRTAHPIKARDRKLQLMRPEDIPEFALSADSVEFDLTCEDQDFSNGLIISFCYPPDGKVVCLTTVDRYLLLFNAHAFELQTIFRLRDFVIKESAFLPKPKASLIFGLTTAGTVGLFDCDNTEFKMVVQTTNAVRLSISNDGKLLSILSLTGEVNIWSTSCLYNALKSQEQCMTMLKEAFKQSKPLAAGTHNEALHADLKKLLKIRRLQAILREYGCYPAKYRSIIWSVLLKLPNNAACFQQILKMGVPPAVQRRIRKIKMKNETLRRALENVNSCLAHWCKVFAHSEFLPKLIFPFVKMFPRNALVAFEICVTLLLNHFQLWFEFHPLEPTNYLGIIENILQSVDGELAKFYTTMQITPVHFAWSLLENAFSEVLSEEQWLCLWDNILSCQPYFLVFCVVAYNVLQREIIMRLPNKDTIVYFFHEQNPIDATKLLAKAYKYMAKCASMLHPKRFMTDFQPIPKGVYPKFVKYPREWLERHESEVAALQREQCEIDARIRELEQEEYKVMERLENGLKEAEHAKRMKEMEQLYQNTIKYEQERLACQRRTLLLYQKEMRSRKSDVLATLQESERRKKALLMERDLDTLLHKIECERLRNDTKLNLAEDDVRNEELNLYAEKYFTNTKTQSLSQKYCNDMQRLRREQELLTSDLREAHMKPKGSASEGVVCLSDIEKQLDAIQREFDCITQTTK